jgi:hypothetical protein
VLGLILASGVGGLLLGRYFKVYACFPTILVLFAAACFIGRIDGWMSGLQAFVFSVIALQLCYLIGVLTRRAFGNSLAPTKAPSRDFM